MELWQLRQRQKLQLESKIVMTSNRIKQWYQYYKGQVYVSFSGGKDSTVLLHLVRTLYPEVTAVFVDTGLEYPEIKRFVNTQHNVITIRPEMTFIQVIQKYGYPVVSKKVARQIKDLQNPTPQNLKTRMSYKKKRSRYELSQKWRYLTKAPFKISDQCCEVMKIKPIRKYQKENGLKAMLGTVAQESKQREATYLQYGCFNYKKEICTPIAFWTEKDVWQYIKDKKIHYATIYNTGVQRTGCMFCMFGIHLEKEPNRFQLMKKTHHKLYQYGMQKLKLKTVMQYLQIEHGTQTNITQFFNKK